MISRKALMSSKLAGCHSKGFFLLGCLFTCFSVFVKRNLELLLDFLTPDILVQCLWGKLSPKP